MNEAQPTLDGLVDELRASIVLLLEAHQPLSAMMLLYSGIDVLGALDSDGGVATRDTFLSWADEYMKSDGAHSCSSLELYSARCGLLHRWSPITNLTKSGVAREVIYAIDRPRFQQTQQAGGLLIIHPPWLWLTFRDGSSRFVDNALKDASSLKRVNKNLEGVYFERRQ